MAERILIEARSVSEALREAAKKLKPVSGSARLDSELLMAHALNVSRTELLLRRMRGPVPESFAALIDRRSRSEPIAYITGVQEFYGREFAVRPGVLIPRSDSETIVETALEIAPSARRVLDCGTGSGALLLSFLSEQPEARGVGMDASRDALQVATENCDSLGLTDRAQFVQRDWTKEGWREGCGLFDLILSNPPYVEFDADLDRDVRDFEPAEALFSGEEGLDDYRILIPQLRALLTDNGVIVLEIGCTQAKAVGQLARDAGFTPTLYRDLAGRPRALQLTSHK